jgi:hypothetical protein
MSNSRRWMIKAESLLAKPLSALCIVLVITSFNVNKQENDQACFNFTARNPTCKWLTSNYVKRCQINKVPIFKL